MPTDVIKVLLVDDDEDDFIIARELFYEIDQKRYIVEWADNFHTALEKMAEGQHDVYLVDYRLGGNSGLDILRQALVIGCNAPIILLTGQGEHEVDVEAMRAGADFYHGLIAAVNCRVSVVELDLSAVTDITAVLDTVGEFLDAETGPGDRIIGHSFGAGFRPPVAAGFSRFMAANRIAAAVDVRIEAAVRRVAHDAGGARHLLAVALQHAPVHAGQRRRDPGQLLAVHHRALAEIGVDFHCLAHPAALTPSNPRAS